MAGMMDTAQAAATAAPPPMPMTGTLAGGDIPRSVSLPLAASTTPTTESGYSPIASTYSPQAAGSRMEGGYAAARAGPGGDWNVNTLEAFRTGEVPYVTLAGDDSELGKRYTIPSITYTGPDGKSHTLNNVPAVMHDRGSAFVGTRGGRIDIPVARDMSNAQMSSQPFNRQGVRLIPALDPQTGMPRRIGR